MPKRVVPQWGNRGVVRVPGSGSTDDQLTERGHVLGEQGRGDRGCALSDAQFDRLRRHLKTADPAKLANARESLEFIRDVYLKSRLYQSATPKRAERNAALAVLGDQLRSFLAAVDLLGPMPDWVLVENGAPEEPTFFLIFSRLSGGLRVLAERNASGHNQVLASLSEPADRLATTLFLLDHASQNDILSVLPPKGYAIESYFQLIELARTLSTAVDKALAAGRRQGGPLPFPELIQAVTWLADVYEACGGKFTHTPRERTHYDGVPRSAAGRFVVAFFQACDAHLSPQTISSAMDKVVAERKRPASA